MFSLRSYREPTHRLPDYLPWAALVAPGVILQKDAALQKTLAFRGPDLASASPSELVSAVARLNNALRRLGSGWSIFIEAQRFSSAAYCGAQWHHHAAWLVDLERKGIFEEAGSHFESAYYLTFVRALPSSGTARFSALFYEDPQADDPEADNERELQLFIRQVGEIADILSGVFVEVRELGDDETLGYLHSTISTSRHRVQAPDRPMYLDALLPDVALTVGDVCMLGDRFIPTISFTGFPSSSVPGMLDELNHLEIEYRWAVRYIALDREDARKEIEKYRRQWWSKRKSLLTLLKEEATKEPSALVDSSAANKAADADAALQELGDDLLSFGMLTCTVTVAHPDLQEALRRIRRVKQVVQGRGFVVKDETLNSLEAWLGSLPGHLHANVRRPLISTLNLAHLMPLSAIWSGDAENHHLLAVCGCGAPHMLCSTTGSTPFRLSLNVGDVGHTLVVGPTGAGKSTLLSMLALQWLRYPGAQVVIFDKDRSSRAATFAAGGDYYEPGGETAPLSFQPLREVDLPAERIWASEFILLLLRMQHVEETPSLKKEVDGALENFAFSPKEQRTMTLFADMVQHTVVRDALRPYTVEGSYGGIFDADDEAMGMADWVTIEMGGLMGLSEAVLVPALFYLFHRVEGRFEGRPTLLVLDEAWLFLRHPVFMGQLQQWLKTLRKKNVYVVFATQEIADAADSPIMATILSACHTKIYLPDEEALTPAMAEAYARFGLSDTEVTLLAHARKKRDYYYRSVKGRRLFSLSLGPVALAFAGQSGPDAQREMERIGREVPKEGRAAALLRYSGLDWAEELLLKASEASELQS